MQKYPHVIKSYGCNLKTFVFVFLFPINVLIYFQIYSTLKLLKRPKQSSEFQYQNTCQDLLHMPHLLF